ncbi:MAG: sugar transferase [Proteobacteria bacterium]|nr:MAG: sugar transferase [Pseudomonadota bacterium]
MLKQNWRLVSRAQRLGDTLIILLTFFIAYHSRSALIYWNDVYGWGLKFTGDELAPIKDYFIVLVVALIGYTILLNAMGAYASIRLSSTWQLLKVSVVSSICVFLGLAAVLFLLKIDFSRSFVLLFCALVCLGLAVERYLVVRVLRFWRRRGRNFRNVLVCGIGEQAGRLARQINAMPELGLHVRAFVELREDRFDDTLTHEAFKANLKDLGYTRTARILRGQGAALRALTEYAIDEVIFTDVVDIMPQVEELVVICSEQGVRTTLLADLFSIGMVKSGLSYFGDMPLIHFQTPPGDGWELLVKRAIDLAVAAILLVILSPVMLLVAVLIKLTSPGPILYMQRRVGLNGRLFSLYKFRSMFQDADKKLAELLDRNEMKGPVFKMKDDPRITGIGRWLRRFSLDELPQLWNVLIGDMSLVGPRPPVPGEVSMYERRDRRRLSMRPGLTCTWQVSGRSNIKDFESWVKLDLDYIDNWSLGRDIGLMFRTIPAVIFGTGAR